MTRRNIGIIAFIAVLTTVTSAGCRSPRRGTTVQNGTFGGTAQTGGGAGGAGVSNDPRQALEQIEQFLTQQGLARTNPAVRNPNLPTNGVIAYAIEGQPGICYTIVAIAQPTSDLNLVVLDPAGQTVGYNVSPDQRPWATVCPQTAGRMIARLQMASGGGEYYYAVYQGPSSTRPDLNAFYGGGQSQGPERATIDPATQQRLGELDRTLGQEGFQRISEPYGEVYGPRQDRMFALNLSQGVCYAFASLGGQGVRDTDVFLVDGSGNEIERDVSTNVDAMVRFCPQQTGSYSLRARLYSGEGPLFTVGYQQSHGTTANTPPPTNVIAAQSTAGAGLDDNFRLLDSDMRARGYESYGDPMRNQLEQGATQEFPIQLEGGKCYAILAVGDNGIRDLDLILTDSSGRQVDRDVETDARPIVRVCAAETGSFTMQVKMYSGAGGYIYAAYKWPRGTHGPFNLSGIIYVRLAEVTSLLAVEGYEPDVDATPGDGNLRRQDATARENIELTGGQCYAILAVGGEGVNNLDITLASGSTQVAADTTRTAFPDIRFCPPSSGRYTLNIKAASGSGRYFYQVFRRSGGH